MPMILSVVVHNILLSGKDNGGRSLYWPGTNHLEEKRGQELIKRLLTLLIYPDDEK
jgi:hypothetical protein